MKTAVALLLISLPQPICVAQKISVLVLDVGSEKPVPNKSVSAQFHVSATPKLQELKATTGVDGVAIFDMPSPMPPQATFMVTDEGLYPCSSLLPIDLQLTIAQGVVSRCSRASQGCRCHFSTGIMQLKPAPRRLVILV